MSLDLSKLQNVKTVAGKTTARCPACAATGGDAKGDHLVIYPDGGYGCVANPRDKAHTKEIFRLVGVAGGQGSNGSITVRAVNVPASSVLMDLKGFDRFRVPPTPRPQKAAAPAGMPEPAAEKPTADATPPPPASMDAGEPPPSDNPAVNGDEPSLHGDWVDLDGKPCRGERSQHNVGKEPLWSFLGVSEEAFNGTARREPVASEDAC